MLQHARCYGLARSKKNVRCEQTQDNISVMSDEALRRQIFANAAVLFPTWGSQQQPSADFEIVLALCPVCTAGGRIDSPAQYAMLVRQAQSGEYVPLLKGEAFSHSAPWTKPLQSLFNASAKAIHLKYIGTRFPPPGAAEDLPRYERVDSAITQ